MKETSSWTASDRYVSGNYVRSYKPIPDLTFFFQPADIVTQILNFGLPAPIDVQVQGYDPANYEITRHLREAMPAPFPALRRYCICIR